jgi:hypothetical protein
MPLPAPRYSCQGDDRPLSRQDHESCSFDPEIMARQARSVVAITMIDSGQIRLDANVIRYRSTTFGDWELRVSDLRILGECTDQWGPFANDYFFCFATGPGFWLQASFYAEGRDDFLRDLGAKLGSPLVLGLCHSTDFASRVLWPPSLAGDPMFKYMELPSKGLLRRLFRIRHIRQTYADKVAAMLAAGG